MLPQVTFSSVYWVRVTTTHTSGRRVAQQVYFVTPTCQTLEHVTTICVNQDASEGPATNSSYIQSYTEGSLYNLIINNITHVCMLVFSKLRQRL